MLHAKPGASVRGGEPMMTLHTDTPERFERALRALEGAIDIAPPNPPAGDVPLDIDRGRLTPPDGHRASGPATTTRDHRPRPKVLLHDHLDGGLRPATVIELAEQIGYDELPARDADELGRWFRSRPTPGRWCATSRRSTTPSG